MEELVLDGKSYVKASKAAKDLGYATDYVGQLCRSGQVDSHLIGRTWYVHKDDLISHKTEKKRISRVKAREYAKKSIAESKSRKNETQNIYKKVDIRYESDNESLLPDIKKLSVQSEAPNRAYQEIPEGDELSIENKGAKVRMSGKLSVVDVTDSPIDKETTVLKPRIISVMASDSIETEKAPQTEFVQQDIETVKPKISFIKRLEESNVYFQKETAIAPQVDEVVENQGEAVPLESTQEIEIHENGINDENEIEENAQKKDIPMSISVAVVLGVIIISMLTTGIFQKIEYTPLDSDTVISDTSYKFSIGTAKQIILEKI